MLSTQFFLQSHSLETLCKTRAIKAVRHEKFPNLVMLKYNQIFSPMADPVVQECRGLILDEAQKWAIVSHPFHKFFNAGEPLAPEIDWESVRVFEKLDGSLMSLYFYGGAWQVASNGRPEAGGPMGSRAGETMAQVFWEIWTQRGLKLPSQEFAGWWFGFEFTTPWNQVVVRHQSPQITLIGARKPDGCEVFPDEVPFDWPRVRVIEIGDLEAIRQAANAIEGGQGEGFVVCDAQFRRLKIKAKRYVELHQLRDEISTRRLLEILQRGEGSEVLVYFPEVRAQFESLEVKYLALAAQIEDEFARIGAIDSQREFALAVQNHPLRAGLFARRKGVSAAAFLSAMTINGLFKALGVRELAGGKFEDEA